MALSDWEGRSGTCVFPFYWKGQKYDYCAQVGRYGGHGWCSMTTHFIGRGGWCTNECPQGNTPIYHKYFIICIFEQHNQYWPQCSHITIFSVPDINCKITFLGGCKEGDSLVIKRYDERQYTVKECYALCSRTDYCHMFSIQSENSKENQCVLFKMGCTNSGSWLKNSFYAMHTCSGIHFIQSFYMCSIYM